MTSDTSDLSSWIGNKETVADDITLQSVAGMSATLGRDDPSPQKGDPLPTLWHWMYFTPKVARAELGPDGHPKKGGFLPPVPLPRRMFAGARYVFHKPLVIGAEVTKTSTIQDVTSKQGKTGPLVFITVHNSFSMGSELAMEEEQDIVYREEGTAKAAVAPSPPRVETPADAWRAQVIADPVSLFRYSALTFNGHRIHYDYPYATEVEGYPDLVVHGPLIASYLIELYRKETNGRAIASFFFRAKRPLFANKPFELTGGLTPDGAGFWLKALTPDGAEAMEAGGTFKQEGN